MNQNDKEAQDLEDVYATAQGIASSLDRDGHRAGLVAVADHTKKSILARGGTMTAEEIDRLLTLHVDMKEAEDAIRVHIAAQGATAATLQANAESAAKERDIETAYTGILKEAVRVVSDERDAYRTKLEACEAALQDAQTEQAMWEAEAQRLRAENARLDRDWRDSIDEQVRLAKELVVVESRLANILETKFKCAHGHPVDVAGMFPPEGGAPQEAKPPDISQTLLHASRAAPPPDPDHEVTPYPLARPHAFVGDGQGRCTWHHLGVGYWCGYGEAAHHTQITREDFDAMSAED